MTDNTAYRMNRIAREEAQRERRERRAEFRRKNPLGVLQKRAFHVPEDPTRRELCQTLAAQKYTP